MLVYQKNMFDRYYFIKSFCNLKTLEKRFETLRKCLDTGMQNDDDDLLSISLAGHGQLVKMLITFEPHGIFSLNFVNLYI